MPSGAVGFTTWPSFTASLPLADTPLVLEPVGVGVAFGVGVAVGCGVGVAVGVGVGCAVGVAVGCGVGVAAGVGVGFGFGVGVGFGRTASRPYHAVAGSPTPTGGPAQEKHSVPTRNRAPGDRRREDSGLMGRP